MLEIPYNYSMDFGDSLIIPDDGEFALEFLGEHGNSYVIVKTLLGLTTIMFWGPLVPGVRWLNSNYKFEFSRVKFSKSKIYQKMSEYANSRTLKNYSISVVTEEYAKGKLKEDIADYLNNYKEIEDEFAQFMELEKNDKGNYKRL